MTKASYVVLMAKTKLPSGSTLHAYVCEKTDTPFLENYFFQFFTLIVFKPNFIQRFKTNRQDQQDQHDKQAWTPQTVTSTTTTTVQALT